jgi:hypothetical protein
VKRFGNTEENCEMIWKIWKKCEMIWKIWSAAAAVVVAAAAAGVYGCFCCSGYWFLPYFPYLFTIQLTFSPYFPYHFTFLPYFPNKKK